MSTFAEQMVAKLQALLLANPGAKTVNVDGNQVTFEDLVKQHEYWQKRVAIESGARPRFSTIDLGNT